MSEEKMIERVVTQSVTVIREGKRVTPPLNKSFPFTADEITYLDSISPRASRKPVDESERSAPVETDEDVETEDETETKPKGKGKAKAEDSTDDDI